MIRYRLFSILAIVLWVSSCKAQESVSRIEIMTPTIQQEATSIWRTINDITFYEEQGYSLHLPKDEQIEALIKKSKKGDFGNDDFATIYNLLETKFFNEKHYDEATKKVLEQRELINSLIRTIESKREEWDWEFHTFKKYPIVFTLYGTGGSYNPDNGIITILTTKEGGFMNYKNPANTIVHEITHMGMEYSIVQKYKLSHVVKERIVDTFVHLMFSESLPDYRIQDMGDTGIDDLLRDEKDIHVLDATISDFVTN